MSASRHVTASQGRSGCRYQALPLSGGTPYPNGQHVLRLEGVLAVTMRSNERPALCQ